jgi:chromosome segregation ATPase
MRNFTKRTAVVTTSTLLLAMICGSATVNGSEGEKKQNFFQKLFSGKKKAQPKHEEEIETKSKSEELVRAMEERNAEIERIEQQNAELRKKLKQSLNDFGTIEKGGKVSVPPSASKTTEPPLPEKKKTQTKHEEEIENTLKQSEEVVRAIEEQNKKIRDLKESNEAKRKELKKATKASAKISKELQEKIDRHNNSGLGTDNSALMSDAYEY